MDTGLRTMSRYSRQIMVPDVGIEGQELLHASHVLVVGAGGLGCPALQYLVGAGVGRITVIDPDRVEESNLHRQSLFRIGDIGSPKAWSAKKTLNELNPAVAIGALSEVLTPSNAPELAELADIVIDAADSFAVSYTLSDACRELGTPLISASVLGQSGYIGCFCADAPSLRAVFPTLPETSATCATTGVLGPVVGVVGAMLAQFALRTLLGSDPSPVGQMVTIDLASLRFETFSFLGSPEPDEAIPFLAPEMLKTTDRIFDLRGEDEAAAPIVSWAVRMTNEELRTIPQTPNRRIVLCCSTGLRAWRVALMLRHAGHDNLALLAARAGT